MRCAFKDGFEVDYSGSLSVSKGEQIGVILSAADIPAGFKSYLDAATRYNSCRELRTIAQEAAAAVGANLGEE